MFFSVIGEMGNKSPGFINHLFADTSAGYRPVSSYVASVFEKHAGSKLFKSIMNSSLFVSNASFRGWIFEEEFKLECVSLKHTPLLYWFDEKHKAHEVTSIAFDHIEKFENYIDLSNKLSMHTKQTTIFASPNNYLHPLFDFLIIDWNSPLQSYSLTTLQVTIANEHKLKVRHLLPYLNSLPLKLDKLRMIVIRLFPPGEIFNIASHVSPIEYKLIRSKKNEDMKVTDDSDDESSDTYDDESEGESAGGPPICEDECKAKPPGRDKYDPNPHLSMIQSTTVEHFYYKSALEN